MRRSPLAGWFVFGILSLTTLAVFGMPLLPETGTTTIRLNNAEVHASVSPTTSASVLPMVQTALVASNQAAAQAIRCQVGAQGIKESQDLVYYRKYDDADLLLSTLLDDDCIEDATERDKARFQHAYLLHLLDRPAEVIDRLDELETQVPIADFVYWLRGESLEKLDRHQEAADAFGAIYQPDNSPLHWRARARQAKSLVAAENWEDAQPILAQIVDTFPDYPRRHRALYYQGKTYEALGELEKAAKGYQAANFEFPFKQEGRDALTHLQALAEKGIEPDPIDREKLFAHYRQLRVDKFWPLAHQLLTDLREENSTPDGNSEFENKILLQIALNAYHSHDFESAAQYFAQAREIFEAGHTRGFQRRTLYRFHSFALARLGRHDEAIDALNTMNRNAPRRTRLQDVAYHHERHGEYEKAYQLYDQVYSAGQKRGWHFSYLTYKTGRFEDAYENLQRLATRSSGETRAKYLYWASRSLERAGKVEEAYELFTELKETRPHSYYGLQAANRLNDLQQRTPADSGFIAQTDFLTEQADQALDAFEQASFFAGSGGGGRFSDPRTQPLAGEPTDDLDESEEEIWQQEMVAAVLNEQCTEDDFCSPGRLGLPFPSYGLTWNLGRPLLDARTAHSMENIRTRAARASAQEESLEGLDRRDSDQVRVPRADIEFPDDNVPRIRFNTEARIYWNGRRDSDVAFVNYDRGNMIGPVPTEWTAYDDDTHHGGLERAVETAGDLFPNLKRAQWLWLAGWNTEARRVIRDVSLEFRSLSSRSRASRTPHELPQKRWGYYIDNRRHASRADYWGMSSDEKRFPVPEDNAEAQALLERQQDIFDRRRDLQPIMVEAYQEVGDYHLVRRHALGDTWWLRQAPDGDARRYWAMAYPRAFPEKVIPLAEKHNVNPYMIWALMLVESSFNPDSISIADALGLLQVIPRTGQKIATLFGSEDFGPFDLLEEDHSIEQGIFYFSKLVQKFHGQELMAFAGYNGGPHRVGGWLDNRGHRIPLDEFVEEIPFDQSRGYAKKVLRFLQVYLRIYEGYDEGLYVGQNVRQDYLEQPDF